MLDELLDRFRRKDRFALARLLTLATRGQLPVDVLHRLPPVEKPARVLAVTGSAGVGKSTLVGRLIETIRKEGASVAVLACDPKSPLTGGALLGDRFRMPTSPQDGGVFIRSLATPGGQGAIVEAIPALVTLLEKFGFDVILIETVGAGQGDVAVRGQCDVLVLLLQPETGDDLQWEKAGVLEVADVLVIHKADLPGAAALEGQVKQMLSLGMRPVPPIVRVSSRSGTGMDELWQTVRGMPLRRHAPSAVEELLRLGQQTLAVRMNAARQADDGELKRLVEQWQTGQVTAASAGATITRLLQARFGEVQIQEGDTR